MASSGRKMRNRGSKWERAKVGLSEDVLLDILVRLPIKSLCRFKCVHKSWLHLNSQPGFITAYGSHPNRSAENPCGNQRLFILSWYCSFISLEYDPTRDINLRVIQGENVNREWETILGSYNGIVSVVDVRHDIFLLNPSTSEHVELPKSPWDRLWFYVYGFCYDSSNEDYKVVRISSGHNKMDWKIHMAFVYSLASNSWKRIQDWPYNLNPQFSEFNIGISSNGALHWIAPKRSMDYYTIVSLSLSEETFVDFPVPFPHINPSYYKLGTFGEWFCVFHTSNGYDVIQIWVMKEYGVGNSWTRLNVRAPGSRVSLKSCFPWSDLIVLRSSEHGLLLYDPKKRTCRNIRVDGKVCSDIRVKAAVSYAESFVSLRNLVGAKSNQTFQ